MSDTNGEDVVFGKRGNDAISRLRGDDWLSATTKISSKSKTVQTSL